MRKGLPLQALRQPLRGGWWLQIRQKSCTTACERIDLLPVGHMGVSAVSGAHALVWKSNGRGPSATILETERYRWEIGHDGESRPEGPMPELDGCRLFKRDSTDGDLPAGDLCVVNYLGVLGLHDPARWRRTPDGAERGLKEVEQ